MLGAQSPVRRKELERNQGRNRAHHAGRAWLLLQSYGLLLMARETPSLKTGGQHARVSCVKNRLHREGVEARDQFRGYRSRLEKMPGHRGQR